jgi:hypothetical protein
MQFTLTIKKYEKDIPALHYAIHGGDILFHPIYTVLLPGIDGSIDF